jgi:hypothetical protein
LNLKIEKDMVLLIPSKNSATTSANTNINKATISTTSLEKVRREQQRGCGNECDGDNAESVRTDTHWSENITEYTLSSRDIAESDAFSSKLKGGSDNNLFIYLISPVFANDKLLSPSRNKTIINQFDIILEVNNFKISGYTFNDVIKLLEYLTKTESLIKLRTVKSQLSQQNINGSTQQTLLPLELNKFLEVPFQKGSIEYDLQQTIRDNVYERTVPCTTRPPRPGEIHGQDYVFLSNDEFVTLKNNSLLLEYGFYNGFMYGTPIPPPHPRPLNDKANSSVKSFENNESKLSGKIKVFMF